MQLMLMLMQEFQNFTALFQGCLPACCIAGAPVTAGRVLQKNLMYAPE